MGFEENVIFTENRRFCGDSRICEREEVGAMLTEKDLYGPETPPRLNIDPKEVYRTARAVWLPGGTNKFMSDIADMFRVETKSTAQRIALMAMLETVFMAGVMYSKQELNQGGNP